MKDHSRRVPCDTCKGTGSLEVFTVDDIEDASNAILELFDFEDDAEYRAMKESQDHVEILITQLRESESE